MSAARSAKHLGWKTKELRRRVAWLVKSPLFWWITLWGNSCVFGGAVVFHFLESPVNPSIHSFVDSLFWAVGIVSTVGGGGPQPITMAGKVLAIFMMMGGAVFLWSYMGLFVGTLVDPDLSSLKREVDELGQEVKGDEELLRRMSEIVSRLEERLELDSSPRVK